MATILSQVGWRTQRAERRLPTYRREVCAACTTGRSTCFVLLDGHTVSAKTEVLGRLAAEGCQTLDLEGSRRTAVRCSAASAAGRSPARSCSRAGCWGARRLDPARVVVAEAESSKIGDRMIPPALVDPARRMRRRSSSAPSGRTAPLPRVGLCRRHRRPDRPGARSRRLPCGPARERLPLAGARRRGALAELAEALWRCTTTRLRPRPQAHGRADAGPALAGPIAGQPARGASGGAAGALDAGPARGDPSEQEQGERHGGRFVAGVVSLQGKVSAEEWQARVDLRALYRLVAL
jgi:tRNA 2-selenouridine synthase